MKKNCFLIIHIILFTKLHAQSSISKKWDRTIGGNMGDVLRCLYETEDGGFILGGSSASSTDQDKSQSNRDSTLQTGDYWIVKTDVLGNKKWDKTFGSRQDDYMNSLQQTADGGYILGGISSSGISGDKTQASWGDADFWIVKIDSLGNKQWDRSYGGSDYDALVNFMQTTDGGYILGGLSESPVSGDVTEPSRGASDYWIVKIDSLGNKQWDKRFGTSNQDFLGGVIQTSDGGYIMGGFVLNGIDGDKTQPLIGSDDYWIVKTDSVGNKLWDKDYGGTGSNAFYTLAEAKDHGYILAGYSNADTSINKSQNKKGYWIVKSDSLGNEEWDKTFSDGWLTSIFVTSDGGFLLGGMSSYDTTVDKSENNLGQSQSWIVKTDAVGNKQWDRTILTNDSFLTHGTDIYGGYSIQTKDGGYLVGSPSNSGIAGYKTQNSKGNFDYFIVKLGDSTIAGIQEPEGVMNLKVYPNPTVKELSISIEKDNIKEASFLLTTITGKTVYQNTADHLSHSYTKTLDLSRMPSGIYMLEVTVDNERIVKKIVKE